MLSSDVLTIGHPNQHDVCDCDGRSGDGDMEHRPKRRNNNSRTDNPVTEMRFEFAPSVSPAPLSSPSGSSSYSSSITEDAHCLPKRISILNSIIRPIPKRVSTQFYDEAYRNGLTLQDTNQAAIMAHDWHRKWTHQDEANHTMPERDFYQTTSTTAAGIPDSYGYNEVFEEQQNADHELFCLEREGAKNPSLGSYLEDTEKQIRSVVKTVVHRPTPKRLHSAIINDRQLQLQQQHRVNTGSMTQSQQLLKGFQQSDCHNINYEGKFRVSSTETTEASTTMDSSSSYDNQVKRVFTTRSFDEEEIFFQTDDDDESSDDESQHYNTNPTSVIQRPLPIRPVVVKPVAIHAKCPDYGLPQHEQLSPFGSRNGNNIPRDIVTQHEFDRAEIVSPMSYSQLSCDQSSLGNEMIGMTVMESDQQQDYLHLVEDDGEDMLPTTTTTDTSISTPVANNMEKARDDMLHNLAISDGDVESKDFETKLDPLQTHFLGKDVDTRSLFQHQLPDSVQTSVSGSNTSSNVANAVEGTWLTLSKPNWFGKLGENDNGDPLYTLGRMSFDMFSPTNLVCSLQGNFNRIEIVSGEDRKAMLEAVPKKLREEVESGKTVLRTYNVVTAFTIESSIAAFPDAPNKDVIRPIRGIMTTYGYSLPDPDTPNRHSVWFTGGRIEPNNDMSDILPWKNFFTLHPPSHSFGEKAKLLAVKLLMGATIPKEVDEEDGSMNYVFTRPLGGHGMVYVDVLYIDESLRIVKGQRGTTFVFSRVPDI